MVGLFEVVSGSLMVDGLWLMDHGWRLCRIIDLPGLQESHKGHSLLLWLLWYL